MPRIDTDLMALREETDRRFDAIESRLIKQETIYDIRYAMIEKELHKFNAILSKIVWMAVTASGAILYEVIKK